MRRYAVPLAVLVLVALPATALADIRFRGKTGQRGFGVVLRTGDDGIFKQLDIGWRARCGVGTYTHSTKILAPLDSLTRDRFVDADAYRERVNDGFRSIIDARVAGNRVSEARWRGIFRVRVRVFKGSRRVDTCYKRTRWRALRR
jgi:hypothetical protein